MRINLYKNMKIPVLCDDIWHPAHIPQAGLEALKNTEFNFEWIETSLNWSPERMEIFPLVILAKSNNVSSSDPAGWMTEAMQAAFVDYVRSGGGLLAIHSGTATYDEMLALRSLLGGVFMRHPAQCPVTVTPRTGHPLTVGCSPFTLMDEHYIMALDDLDADVYVTTRSEYGEQPGAWRRTEGAGRVAVLTLGHNLEVWLHPSFQALLRNAIRWCGGMQV